MSSHRHALILQKIGHATRLVRSVKDTTISAATYSRNFTLFWVRDWSSTFREARERDLVQTWGLSWRFVGAGIGIFCCGSMIPALLSGQRYGDEDPIMVEMWRLDNAHRSKSVTKKPYENKRDYLGKASTERWTDGKGSVEGCELR